MRGEDRLSGSLFSYVDLEARVPARHPLRLIRGIVNDVLGSLSTDFAAVFHGACADGEPQRSGGRRERDDRVGHGGTRSRP